MIEKLYIHGFRRIPQLARHLQIRRTRRRIAAWMIVRANNRGRGFPYRGPEYFARVRERRRGSARADLDALDQAVFSVQAEHPEFLHCESGCEWQKIVRNQFRAV